MVLKMRKSPAPERPLCPIGTCMEMLGGAWGPQVIWRLSHGGRRFSELQADMAPISAKVLSQRLKDLESRGVITRTVMNTSPPSVEYALTDLGHELVPAIEAIAHVGFKLRQRRAGKAA
jgi:DNA-binding HxlR family transcriptional regulator